MKGERLDGKKRERNEDRKESAGCIRRESQARNRYSYFASQARKEGYRQIANIFVETADNEKEHAKIFFNYLEGGDVEITAAYPGRHHRRHLGKSGGGGRSGENLEWTTLYSDFAKIARDEGFPEIANSFDQIAKGGKIPRSEIPEAVEQYH